MSRKVALVTGGSRGIGRAVCLELSRGGYSVVVNYRSNVAAAGSVVAEIAAAGGEAWARAADVSDHPAVKALIDWVETDLGPIEVAVCNAGLTRDTLAGASTPAEFDEVLATNLGGTVNVCRELARRMASRRRGSIVTLSSVAAQRPGRGQSNYAASKGAVESFTRALAVELAPRGVRVNGVAPGVIATELTAQLRAEAPEEVARRILLRRPGTAQEVARVIAFLAGEGASYVTGQIWNVDGGFKLE